MADWFSSLTSKISGMLGAKTPSVHVCVFGKHPGWNDHIDDLGLDSEPLIVAKEALYVHGIGSVVDSGKWESTDESAIPYRHIFAWRDSKNIIFGRMWDSSDGKGRTKYPMVICVHLANRASAGLPDATLFLEQLESSCRSATSAEAVHGIVHSARQQAAYLLDAPVRIFGSRVKFAESLGITPTSDSAVRIAYSAESVVNAVKGAPTAVIDLKLSRSSMQSQHVRVPADPMQPFESLAFWTDFFAALIPFSVPQFFLASLDAPWLDVIVGPVTSKNLVCIRSGKKSVPLATDIPFNIPQAERERAEKLWGAFLG